MAAIAKKFPEKESIAVCKVNKVLDYGVFVELLEFPGLQGFVHISAVASSWIKNIRNFVRENQIRAGRVVFVDASKNQVDIAFNKVTEEEEKTAINEFRTAKRSRKLIELLAKERKKSVEETWKEVAEPLIQEFGFLFNAFNEIKLKREKALERVASAWHKPLLDLVDKNIEMPVKTIKGIFSIKCKLPDGVEVIKNNLGGMASGKKGIEVSYNGSGNYSLKIQAASFKSAEKTLEQVTTAVLDSFKREGCEAKFVRQEA